MTKITLKTPIEHDGVTYDSIQIREPSLGSVAAYVKSAPEGELAASIAMVAVMNNMPEEALRKVTFSDFSAAMVAVTPFLEGMIADSGAIGASSQPTSPTS